MHIREHITVPALGIVIWVDFGTCTLPHDYAYPSMTTAMVFIAASVIPDIGNSGYYIVAYLKNIKLPLSEDGWEARENRLFAAIDKRSYWSWTYKLTHSALILLPVMMLLYWHTGQLGPTAKAYAAGHMLHIVMDYYSHQVSYVVWPVWISISDDATWNWWHRQKEKARLKAKARRL